MERSGRAIACISGVVMLDAGCRPVRFEANAKQNIDEEHLNLNMNLEMAMLSALSSGETITVTTSGGSYAA